MSTLTAEELQKIEDCPGEVEWNQLCLDIKKAHGGYPADWFIKVIAGGVFQRLEAKWNKPGAFGITLGTRKI